jgi:hypothetical protein
MCCPGARPFYTERSKFALDRHPLCSSALTNIGRPRHAQNPAIRWDMLRMDLCDLVLRKAVSLAHLGSSDATDRDTRLAVEVQTLSRVFYSEATSHLEAVRRLRRNSSGECARTCAATRVCDDAASYFSACMGADSNMRTDLRSVMVAEPSTVTLVNSDGLHLSTSR